MKKIKVLIFAIIFSILSTVGAFAETAGNPFLLGSSVTDTMTAAKQLGILDDNMVKSDVVTRKNLCRMIVRFYRASTGGTGNNFIGQSIF